MNLKLFATTASMVCAVAFAAVAPHAGAAVLFDENFEGYPPGSNASDKFHALWQGWYVADDGGNRIFKSVDARYSDFLLETWQQFSGNTTIEFATRNNGNSPNWGLSTKMIGEPTALGDWYFYLWADGSNYGINAWWNNDGAGGVSTSLTLGTSQTFDWTQWHDMKLALAGSVAQFYVDGSLLTAYDLSPVIGVPLENFHLSWQTWGQRDLDNITVTAMPVPATLALLGLGIAALACSRRKTT